MAALRHALSAKPFAAREATLLRLVAQAEGIHAQELEMLETAKEATGAFDAKMATICQLEKICKQAIERGDLVDVSRIQASIGFNVAESGRLGRPELLAKRTHIGRV